MKKLLVVEDDTQILEGYHEMFRDYDVRYATTAPQALAMYDKFKPDLLLIDLYLGNGETGAFVIREIRKRDKDVKIIVFSNIESLRGEIEEVDGYYLKADTSVKQIKEIVKNALLEG